MTNEHILREAVRTMVGLTRAYKTDLKLIERVGIEAIAIVIANPTPPDAPQPVNDKLREALEFYADEKNYCNTWVEEIDEDGYQHLKCKVPLAHSDAGKTARQALAELSTTEEQ